MLPPVCEKLPPTFSVPTALTLDMLNVPELSEKSLFAVTAPVPVVLLGRRLKVPPV